MTRTLALVASLTLLVAAACDGRTDRVACNQYADTIGALDCDDAAADDVRTFCGSEDPCADPESSECVSFWDCLSQRATCDADQRFEGNQACAVAADLERQEDIVFD